jgi:hypothetical protein
MDQRLLDLLKAAPSIDLYELMLTINRMLADPARILDIKTRLHLGARVTFFNHETRTLVPGTVMEFRQKEVAVSDDATHKQWWLTYPAVIPDTTQPPPRPAEPAKPMPYPTAFKIGDTVSFTDKYLRDHVGVVIRLNEKTVSLDCDGEQWRVSRNYLRKIIDV